MVLGWSIQQGRRGAMIASLGVISLMGLFVLLLTLLSLTAIATEPMLPAVVQVLLLGGLAALCIRAMMLLMHAIRHPHDAGWDCDDDPYEPVL
jgi:threonine/homoserine/homoserine lactone efflux protein